jgi:predicted Zn-dependent protease
MQNPNAPTAGSLQVLSLDEARSLAGGVLFRLKAKEGLIRVTSSLGAAAAFANNDVRNVAGSGRMSVFLAVSVEGHKAVGETESVTPEGLDSLVKEVENLALGHRQSGRRGLVLSPAESFKDPRIYFDSTLSAAVPDTQGTLIRSAAALADASDVVGAGNLAVESTSMFVQNTAGFIGYTRRTYGEFSMTARTPSGTGSGWAWAGSEDFSNVNVPEIARRAIELAKRGENPVAIEPGRYTVILEPEAVSGLVSSIIGPSTGFVDAEAADLGFTVFSKKKGGNKLGLQLTDVRVQLLDDPDDQLLPFSPLTPDGGILRRTHWIENGVLKNLAYSHDYALKQNREPLLSPVKARLEVGGFTQTLEEMIASTKRGIWVHRFGAVTPVDYHTLLLSGVTRDGTFLIENGKVTKPVKNMRFSESPFFVLNKLESAGQPVRGSARIVCPRLKVHDFEFTSLTDAI